MREIKFRAWSRGRKEIKNKTSACADKIEKVVLKR